jgi:hypothetical protein
VSQLHWTLDPVEHLKDHLNAVQFELPADPGFCKDVKVGTLLDGSFRWGSWLFRQNYGQWSVRVVGKRLAGEDASVPVGRASEVPPPTARPARATASEARAPRLPGKPFDPGPVPALEPVLKPGGGPP